MLIKPEYSHSNLHSDVLSKEEKIILVNCGTQMPVWKDYNFHQTCMLQTTVRGELFRDFRWCDMMHIETHGPKQHNNDARYPMMGFIEQDYRLGKLINTKKS